MREVSFSSKIINFIHHSTAQDKINTMSEAGLRRVVGYSEDINIYRKIRKYGKYIFFSGQCFAFFFYKTRTVSVDYHQYMHLFYRHTQL